MSSDLKKKTVSGLLWSFVEVFGRQGIRFITSIILARLLLPSEFGLIGMINIFIALAYIFLDSGFGLALIQKKNADKTDYSTVFYFNLGISLLIYIILFFSAPLVAGFYNKEILINIIRLFSLSLIINSFSLIQNTILTKRMDFKIIAKINILSAIAAGTVGILLAYKGFGVWSLVIQTISLSAFRTILLWILYDWRPTLVFSFTAFKNLFNFGGKVLSLNILNIVYENANHIIIGKLFSASDLGFYTRAKSLQNFSVNSIYKVIQKVSFPAFSELQNDKIKLLKAFSKSVQMIAFVIFPIMILLMIIAKPFVLVLLTAKWAPSIIYIQILCVNGMIMPLSSIIGNIMYAKGFPGLVIKLTIINYILTAAGIIIGLYWGITGLVVSIVIVRLIMFIINYIYLQKVLIYKVKLLLNDLIPYLLVSLIIGFLTYFSGKLLGDEYLIRMIVQIVFGIATYLFISKMFKLPAFVEMQKIFNNTIKSKITRKKL